MAKAVAISEDSEISEVLQHAGDGMILLITRALWHTLVLQAQSEGITPGAVLDRAMKEYLERHGCQEAVDFLFEISGQVKNE